MECRLAIADAFVQVSRIRSTGTLGNTIINGIALVVVKTWKGAANSAWCFCCAVALVTIDYAVGSCFRWCCAVRDYAAVGPCFRWCCAVRGFDFEVIAMCKCTMIQRARGLRPAFSCIYFIPATSTYHYYYYIRTEAAARTYVLYVQ